MSADDADDAGELGLATYYRDCMRAPLRQAREQ